MGADDYQRQTPRLPASKPPNTEPARLYQINVFSPYDELLGDVDATVSLDGVASQAEMTAPVEPNGFYYVYGKFSNGQTRTAIVFRHEDPSIWGADGMPGSNDVIGDVFSASNAPGSFAYSETPAQRVFSSGAPEAAAGLCRECGCAGGVAVSDWRQTSGSRRVRRSP